MPIRVLTPQEAARIAAGEVIERPASVVKELIENALDGRARAITVETRQGGSAFLRVTDDGEGIPPDELRLAFERHATSKLQSEEELWRIATLGFRGEALPSIAAAADVELVSRPAGTLVAGRIVLRDGEVLHQGSAGAPPGTVVTVERLFRSQPARLKFLRSPPGEATQVAGVVTQYALAYPEVRFTLRADGRTLLGTPGNGDLRDAAAAVYSVELAAELLPIDADAHGSIAPARRTMRPATSAPAGREASSTSAAAAMLGSASPRKPSVAMCHPAAADSSERSLLVAWRSKARRNSSGTMPSPSSVTRRKEMPP